MTCCFINYYISWYCIFLFTNSIVNNTGIWFYTSIVFFYKKNYNTGIIFYTSIVNNTGIPVLWSPSTGDPYSVICKEKPLLYSFKCLFPANYSYHAKWPNPCYSVRAVMYYHYWHRTKNSNGNNKFLPSSLESVILM